MALIVETGGVIAGAESYASVADATAYWAARNEPSAWAAASEAEKEVALRLATEWLDMTFGARWRGVKTDVDSQALDWPRAGALDHEGWQWDSDEIPQALLRATLEAAARQASSELGADVAAASSSIAKETKKAGPVSKSIEYVGEKMSEAIYTRVERLVAELIVPAGTIVRA
jgi:hypothetical protein